ncbi:hypothetical protein FW320_33865 [Azospirillum sp. Vi22]|nr:hypothetical protein [Azospirillum baldaniorum]
MRSCPLPNPPPLSQGRGLPPLRDHLPPLRSGGGPGWGQAPRPSRTLRDILPHSLCVRETVR